VNQYLLAFALAPSPPLPHRHSLITSPPLIRQYSLLHRPPREALSLRTARRSLELVSNSRLISCRSARRSQPVRRASDLGGGAAASLLCLLLAEAGDTRFTWSTRRLRLVASAHGRRDQRSEQSLASCNGSGDAGLFPVPLNARAYMVLILARSKNTKPGGRR